MSDSLLSTCNRLFLSAVIAHWWLHIKSVVSIQFFVTLFFIKNRKWKVEWNVNYYVGHLFFSHLTYTVIQLFFFNILQLELLGILYQKIFIPLTHAWRHLHRSWLNNFRLLFWASKPYSAKSILSNPCTDKNAMGDLAWVIRGLLLDLTDARAARAACLLRRNTLTSNYYIIIPVCGLALSLLD